MYLPCLVFPYQRVPCLWYTPVSVLIHTTPAALAEGAEVVEAEAAGVGFAAAGALEAAAGACGLSELLDCFDCAISPVPLARDTNAMSRARVSFFASRFIDVLLTEL